VHVAAILALALLAVTSVGEPADTPEHGAPAERQELVDEGKFLYGIYCRSCHGPGGRGDGPTARSLKPRPSDLTRLGRDNNGEFPLARVLLSVDGRSRVPGHTKGRMPIWGLSLQEADSDTNQEDAVRRKISCLVEYLKSIQAK
jgi:mono/diheme cytochrome c family protein